MYKLNGSLYFKIYNLQFSNIAKLWLFIGGRYHAFIHFISPQSLNLDGRRGIIKNVVTILFSLPLSSASQRESPTPISVYSLMSSYPSSSVVLSFLLVSLYHAKLSYNILDFAANLLIRQLEVTYQGSSSAVKVQLSQA